MNELGDIDNEEGKIMKKISKVQEKLLERFGRIEYPPEIAIEKIYNFLEEKPEEEPLDPRWKEIWERYKRYASIVALPYVIEEIEEKFKSIELVDEDIWEIKINSNTNIVSLLGAGASAPSGIPTVDKLLEELWKRARKIGREDLDRLAQW